MKMWGSQLNRQGVLTHRLRSSSGQQLALCCLWAYGRGRSNQKGREQLRAREQEKPESASISFNWKKKPSSDLTSPRISVPSSSSVWPNYRCITKLTTHRLSWDIYTDHFPFGWPMRHLDIHFFLLRKLICSLCTHIPHLVSQTNHKLW